MKRADMEVGKTYWISPGGATSYGKTRTTIDRLHGATPGVYLGHDQERVGKKAGYGSSHGTVTDLALFNVAVSEKTGLALDGVGVARRNFGYHEVLCEFSEGTRLLAEYRAEQERLRQEFEAPVKALQETLTDRFGTLFMSPFKIHRAGSYHNPPALVTMTIRLDLSPETFEDWAEHVVQEIRTATEVLDILGGKR